VLRLQEELLGKIDSENNDTVFLNHIGVMNHITTENSTTSNLQNIVPVSILKNGSGARNN
jgi:hypothetical protein